MVALSPQEMQMDWSPPTDDGGRSDLYYEVKHSDPQTLGSFSPPTYLPNSTTTYVISNLTPFTQYCVRVTAHNGVSDQDTDRTHLRTVEDCIKTPEDGKLTYTSKAEGILVSFSNHGFDPHFLLQHMLVGYKITNHLYKDYVDCLFL